ncbi:hypothetical protein IJ096_02170 [Candidatus Saccharibacteria bacterium]|nr:hypothetical protein [Candidatus Saccharibacteria bacterium]
MAKLIEDIKNYKGEVIGESIRFSLPPTGKPRADFKTIKRPEVPELKDFVERYLCDDK